MKLLTFSISNFRGVESQHISAQGRNVNIYGRNGTGKTTTEDAFLWLLFGKDSADRKDYDLIPHKPGSTEPDIGCGKEPTVEASLEYFGKTVKLKKSYIEEWPKKGEFKGQYAGSKTHYFVDDLEVKAGEYQQIVSELVDDKLFKLITNPHYFSEVLSWQERRATLVKIAGDLNVDEGKDLLTMMCGRPFDNFYALAKQTVKTKQKELDGLPYAISEARRMIPAELPDAQDIEALKAGKDALEEQLLTLKNDDAANAQRSEIAGLKAQMLEAENAYRAKIDAENQKIRAGIEKLEAEKRDNECEREQMKRSAEDKTTEVESLTAQKAKKLTAWHEANARIWTGSNICPTCRQSLPKDQVETAKAAFNRQRSEDLERLRNEGTEIRKSIDNLQLMIQGAQNRVSLTSGAITALSERIEKGRTMLKEPCFSDTDEYMAIAKQIDELESAPTENANAEKIDAITSQIRDIQIRIDAAGRAKLQIEQAAVQQKRVDELMAREKSVNAELSAMERAVYLCEQHVKNQAKALERAVNGKFQIARFRMFQMQKNGEEAECCDIIYPNGSTTLSTGERLQTGIDIINTLTGYYGVDAPVWIDNAEGVTLPVDAGMQLIRLIVSDEPLRVEVEQ